MLISRKAIMLTGTKHEQIIAFIYFRFDIVLFMVILMFMLLSVLGNCGDYDNISVRNINVYISIDEDDNSNNSDDIKRGRDSTERKTHRQTQTKRQTEKDRQTK